MEDSRDIWKSIIKGALEELAGGELPVEDVAAEIPPDPSMGDIGFPMFPYARYLKKAPAAIAAETAALLQGKDLPGTVECAGPYLNVRLSKGVESNRILEQIERNPDSYGNGAVLAGQRIMIEFSSPNTNKPLHLGHLRNDALGMSVARLMEAMGGEVLRTNLINDRGIHICKSMLAYQEFGEGRTPEGDGVKSDHFVGHFYVRYDKLAKEDAGAEERAREMLRLWEQGDEPTTRLWETMNGWATSGIEESYRRTGVSFDRVYRESQTYASGREEILRGLEEGIFYKKDDGSLWADLEDIGLDQKVLLRGDGTSLYVTQDVGTAMKRYSEWPFDRLIYVVASEQDYHFRVLFRIMEMLGYDWAGSLYHLSYGMVNLPEGRMKSREGTVVDADDLLDDLKSLAVTEIEAKGREDAVADIDATAEAIAVGALTYYLLQFTPGRDVIFNPAESISFTGNTGPYLQYTGARISSLFRRAAEQGGGDSERKAGQFRAELLEVPEEWELIKAIAAYPEMVALSARDYNPAILASHLYDTARIYNKYYHDHSILNNDDQDLIATRLRISAAVMTLLKRGFHILNIPFLDRM